MFAVLVEKMLKLVIEPVVFRPQSCCLCILPFLETFQIPHVIVGLGSWPLKYAYQIHCLFSVLFLPLFK
jgi:hypothetical protein